MKSKFSVIEVQPEVPAVSKERASNMDRRNQERNQLFEVFGGIVVVTSNTPVTLKRKHLIGFWIVRYQPEARN